MTLPLSLRVFVEMPGRERRRGVFVAVVLGVPQVPDQEAMQLLVQASASSGILHSRPLAHGGGLQGTSQFLYPKKAPKSKLELQFPPSGY